MNIFSVGRTAKYSRVRGRQTERGQAMLIVALAIIGLIAFIGLMVDSGILFIANGHLRRAVDAAALSAATQLREGADPDDLAKAAREFMALNGVDPETVTVETCDYTAIPPAPADLCPDPPRKFIRVTAEQTVRFAFLPIIGFGTFPISAGATSEAASVDAVVVIGASETMAKESPPLDVPGSPYNYGDPFNPAKCNPFDAVTNPVGGATIYPNSPGDGSVGNPFKCRPIWDAKIAAKAFVDKLYDGYDRVAIVTYDYKPNVISPLTSILGTDDTGSNFDSTDVYRAIDQIPIWDEATPPIDFKQRIHGGANPLNFDCNFTTPGSCPGTPTESKSWLAGCSGCGIRVASTILKTTGRPSALWVIVFLSDGVVNLPDLPVAFYSDAATRQNTVLDAKIDAAFFPNGYCMGDISSYIDDTQFNNNPLWSQPFCVTGGHDLSVPPDGDTTDAYGAYRSEKNFQDISVRHCGPYHGGDPAKCPPGAIFVGALGYTTTVTPPAYYDALDYARDMIDQAALTVNCAGQISECTGVPPDKYNQNEPVPGANVAVYSIGLGLAANPPDYTGEEFLRYVAAVGDDGDRVTDDCTGKPTATACGNYYYAPSGAQLIGIFEDIAKRIFTRLTK
jgi:hypothetical protein